MSINFKKVGSLIKIERTGLPLYYYEIINTNFSFIKESDNKISIEIVNTNNPTLKFLYNSITDISIDSVAVVDEDDFDTKIATIFADSNSGGGSVTIPSTAYASNTDAVTALGTGKLYKSTTLINGSPIILLTV
jgi:hypothetical protein